jgi:hypothetical protein
LCIQKFGYPIRNSSGVATIVDTVAETRTRYCSDVVKCRFLTWHILRGDITTNDKLLKNLETLPASFQACLFASWHGVCLRFRVLLTPLSFFCHAACSREISQTRFRVLLTSMSFFCHAACSREISQTRFSVLLTSMSFFCHAACSREISQTRERVLFVLQLLNNNKTVHFNGKMKFQTVHFEFIAH